VLAIVLYVALDLSLASMPGAFVFDAAQSVESPHGGHGRPPADGMILAAVARASSLWLAPAPDVPSRTPVMRAEAPRERATPRSLPRAAVAPASPSEDPH